MKNFLKITLLSTLLFMIIAIPFVSFADDAKGLVPCGTEKTPVTTGADGKPVGGEVINPCTITHVFELVNRVVDYVLKLSLYIAAIMFAYAGFLFMFSGVQPEQRSKAKNIFGKVCIGLVLAFGAWVIINTILTIAGYTGSWTHF